MKILQDTVTIIMLNWNGIDDTLECWKSLEVQTFKNFNTYLVDNGSFDSDVLRLKKKFVDHPKVKLVFHLENLGFTRGNNAVLKACIDEFRHNKYVILLNNDTAVEPDWLENLIKSAELHEADMVASKMINYQDRRLMDNAGHKLLNTLEVLPIGRDEPVENFNAAFENIGPCGGAALYSVDMLREIGILDEHFSNGYEDVELGLRAILCGYKAVYAHDAVVYHKISKSINKIRDFNYTLDIQRNIYYIITKLMPWQILLICMPFLLLRFIIALLINLFSLRWKYLRIQIVGLYHALFVDLKRNLKARRQFLDQHPEVHGWKLLGKMEFFLREDYRRFVKYIIRREKMVFERYG